MNHRFSLPVLSLILFVSWTAEAAQEPKTKQEAEMPNAMSHLVKAPEIDFEHLRDPFVSHLTVEKKLQQQAKLKAVNEVVSKNKERKKEVLENFDITSLKLVAILQKGSDRVAMVEDATGNGYLVRKGQHIGKNNGVVDHIDASTVHISEPSLNPVGEIEIREVKLTLNEVNQ